MKLLRSLITSAALDMGFDEPGAADHLQQFLSAHGLKIVKQVDVFEHDVLKAIARMDSVDLRHMAAADVSGKSKAKIRAVCRAELIRRGEPVV